MKIQCLTITTFIIALLSTVASNAEVRYNVIDLGTLPGVSSSDSIEARPCGINNHGQIVGYVDYYTHTSQNSANRAVLFDSTGHGNNVDLGVVNGATDMAFANSINDNGQIVGWVAYTSIGVGANHAVLFDSSGHGNNVVMSNSESRAYSINNSGQIAGYNTGYMPNLGARFGTIFDATGHGNNITLGTLGYGGSSDAYSINNNGQIVGFALAPGSGATFFDSTGGGNNISLGNISYTTAQSFAYAINDRGQIVGSGWNSTRNNDTAILFDSTGSRNNIDLGGLPGSNYGSVATAINNLNQIVGYCAGRAVLFDSTGGGNNLDLNSLISPNSGWSLSEATGINDNGWIIGEGTNPTGKLGAFLLVPVPEPCSLALLCLGGLLLRRYKN
jgi:uncharacterized membrane protein